MKRGPVFVLGNAKSGTTLVQALLDSHPELFVIPVELKFFKFVRGPSLPPGNMPPPPYSEHKTPITRGEISGKCFKKRIINHSDIKQIIEGKSISRNIKIEKDSFDGKNFEKEFIEGKSESYKEVYISLLKSFRASLSVPETTTVDSMYVEKTPHLEEYAMELKSWFPNARFVHVLRNPYANVYSLRKGQIKTPYLRNKFYRMMAKSHYFMERNKRHIDEYEVFRFEDIVLDTERTAEEIAQHVGIEYQSTLLRPTMMGQLWGGNSRTTEEEFEGIDPRPVDSFQGNISAIDVALVNRFFSKFMEKYDYKTMPTPHLRKWLPSGLESPAAYLANRYLLFDTVL
jgi:hypothetical protein